MWNLFPLSTACIGFFGWNEQCWKVWGWWVGCPTWIPCKWKVPDIICMAGCEIQKGWTKFTAWAEQVGIKVRNDSKQNIMTKRVSMMRLCSPGIFELTLSTYTR